MPGARLVLVYNADASPVALLKDLYSGLKTGTTDCHLCDLTFGRLLKDRSWKAFVDSLSIDVEFKLRSTFKRDHPAQADDQFPAAYVVRDDESIVQVIGAAEMNGADDLEALRTLVTRVVDQLTE